MDALHVMLQTIAIIGVLAVGLWLLWRPFVTHYHVSGGAFEIIVFGLRAVRLNGADVEIVDEIPVELLNSRERPPKRARFFYAAFRPKYVVVIRDRSSDRMYYLSQSRQGELRQVFAALDESAEKAALGR
jgi:hypothetical protein